MLTMTLRSTSRHTDDSLAYLIVSDDVAEGTSRSQGHVVSSIQQGAHITGRMRHDVTDLLPRKAVCSEHLGRHDADDKASHEDGHQEGANNREVEEAQANCCRDCHKQQHLQGSKHLNRTAFLKATSFDEASHQVLSLNCCSSYIVQHLHAWHDTQIVVLQHQQPESHAHMVQTKSETSMHRPEYTRHATGSCSRHQLILLVPQRGRYRVGSSH